MTNANAPLSKDAVATEAKVDQQLQTLSIFHACNCPLSLVMGGNAIVMALLLFKMSLHFTTKPNPQEATPPPQWAFTLVVWGVWGSLILLNGIASLLNIISAALIKRRRGRGFSLATAFVNCLQIPFGTALGAYTIYALKSPAIRARYADRPSFVAH